MVVMIRETFKDILWFLLLLLALLVGFGVAFYVVLGGKMTGKDSSDDGKEKVISQI